MPYIMQPRTETIEAPAEVLPYEEGGEPFRAEVQTIISQRELTALQTVSPPPTWGQLKVLYAPLVRSWNLDAPPPAEGGPDQFDELPPHVWMWLITEAYKVIVVAMQRELPVVSTPPPTQSPAC